MRRHKHSLSHRIVTSMDMGKIYPVSCVEVCMGDVWRANASVLVRVSPLIAPVMHPVHVQLCHFHVPFRLVWDGWENFRTGGPDGLGGGSGALPTINSGGSGFAAKGLLDYMGVPPGVANVPVSALYVRAYNLIWNEYFRDQDLQTALTVPTSSGVDSTSPVVLQKAAWEKDIFTTARPWSQKGPQITLPLGTSASIAAAGASGSKLLIKSPDQANANVRMTTDGAATLQLSTTNTGSPMYADLSTATAATVSQLREAMAMQRYEEARAQWGSRYVEYLRYYGIRPSDARIQRPEYLGGGHGRIAFTEVLQTSDSGAVAGVGDMYGHGIAAVRSRPFVRFFEEDGVYLTLLVVRPEGMYQTGLDKHWSRVIKEDFYTKELELIGQQEIKRKEIYMEAAPGGDTVFGYQNQYREYCEHTSKVTGEMRSTLDFWHMARQFAAPPALNAAFIECDPEKRNFQVATNDVLWCLINNNIRARRFVQRNPTSRII